MTSETDDLLDQLGDVTITITALHSRSQRLSDFLLHS